MSQDINIESKLKEANLYLEHGLKSDADAIYKQILDTLGQTDHPLRKEIELKINGSAAAVENTLDDEAPDVDINSNEHRFENCKGLIDADFHADAMDELRLLLEKGFRAGSVHAKLGECCQALDLPLDAMKHFQEAIKAKEITTQEKLEVLDQLVTTYEVNGDIPEALKSLEKIVATDPNFKNSKQRLELMNRSIKKFGRFYALVRNGAATESQIERAQEVSIQRNKPVESVLINDFDVAKDEIGKSLAEYFKCPFIEFSELEVGPTPRCIKGIKEHFWRQNRCIPVTEANTLITVAALDPLNPQMVDSLRSILKSAPIEFAVALPDDIDKFIDYFHGKHHSFLDEGDGEDVFGELELVDDFEEDDIKEDLSSGASDGVVVKVANRIIEEAYARGVSDIHIESLIGNRGSLVRFRVDGDCSNFQTIPFNYKRPLVSRFKILAKLDIAEKRLPQDGKIKFKTRRGRKIELRVATIPTAGSNEDVVLRILAGGDALPLKHMGIVDDTMATFKKLLEMPYGLILVCGPTGSGKTTTLHAALNYLNRPEKKIWTVEDPVEIIQDGLRQVQVHTKIDLSFARVLKSFLRADPDVIMVGETRDPITATTVIEAALTGHLVFSTLHTNSAPETVTRLLGMGMDPYNFADSLLGVMAQRLIKRLCPHCRKPYKPNKEEIGNIIREYGEHPSKPLGLTEDDEIKLFRANGCAHCHKSGYKGRLAIHELLVNDDVQKMNIETNAPVIQIRKQAMANGMRTLKQDGILKVLQGDTDFKQVSSACIK